MPRISAVQLYRRLTSAIYPRAAQTSLINSTVIAREGKQYISLGSSDRLLLSALRWVHNKNVLYPFGHPFFLLAENPGGVKAGRIEMELPPDHESYVKLSEHIKDNPNPTDKDYEKGKTPLHLDDILSIAGRAADGLAVAQDVLVLLRITPDSIVAKKTRIPGSEYQKWDVRVSDLTRATLAKDGYRGLEGLASHNLSPEELSRGRSTQYSERYRLGILLYALLTRRNPLSAENLKENLKAERNMHSELNRKTEAEKEQMKTNDRLPANWQTLSENEKALFLAKRLYERIEKENDTALENRLWNEPDFARREIYALLKGLLDPRAEKRIEPKDALERLNKAKDSYVRFIDDKLSKGAADMHVGREYGREENIKALGKGGYGAVYGMDGYMLGTGWRKLPRAAKVSLEENEENTKAFEREAEIYRILKDIPNVISVVKGRIHGDLNGFTQKSGRYLLDGDKKPKSGRTLIFERIHDDLNSAERLKKYDSVEHLYDVLSVFIRLAETLQKIHEKGIVHRDLKPENIGMTRGDWKPENVRILDLGLAYNQNDPVQVSQEKEKAANGFVFGTPFYMSPEMANGREITPKSDVFMLAICLYEFLYGEKHANINGSSVIDIFGKTISGERSRKVVDTIQSGHVLGQVREFDADWKAGAEAARAEVRERNESEKDTLKMRPQYIRRYSSLSSVEPDAPLTVQELNNPGKRVRDLLADLFVQTLALSPDLRPDMNGFAGQLKYLKGFIDAEFNISRKRKSNGRER